MTPTAIVFLVLSTVLLWGGLAWSLLRLRRFPELSDDEDVPPST